MAVVSTKELFDKFFEDKDPTTIYKTRGQIDRPEVYSYEIEIGKQLVDMDEDELFNMICTFRGVSSAKSPSFAKHVSNFKAVFQYYSENFEKTANPFHDSKFKRLVSNSMRKENESRLTFDDVKKVIEKLHVVYEPVAAQYYECLTLMFYCGISEPKELAMIKENMINFRRKEIEIDGRIIKLSDRCFDLLIGLNSVYFLPSQKGSFQLESWNGSYFRFPIKKSKINEFKMLNDADIGRKISTMVFKNVNSLSDVTINCRLLYLLGFYDYLVYKFGEPRVKEMIFSSRVNKDIEDLRRSMEDYGMSSVTIGCMKSSLKQFI